VSAVVSTRLVREQAREAMEVKLLLDRVRTEADREENHADPQGGGRDDGFAPRTPGRDQRDADRNRQQDEDGEGPELEAPSLDRFERRRRGAAQPDDPGFTLDLLDRRVGRVHACFLFCHPHIGEIEG
jgi:hypothetical protein